MTMTVGTDTDLAAPAGDLSALTIMLLLNWQSCGSRPPRSLTASSAVATNTLGQALAQTARSAQQDHVFPRGGLEDLLPAGPGRAGQRCLGLSARGAVNRRRWSTCPCVFTAGGQAAYDESPYGSGLGVLVRMGGADRMTGLSPYGIQLAKPHFHDRRGDSVNQPTSCVITAEQPGVLMRLVADGLAGNGFGVGLPDFGDERRLSITSPAARCSLTVEDSGAVTCDDGRLSWERNYGADYAAICWDADRMRGITNPGQVASDIVTALTLALSQGAPRRVR